MLVSNQTNKAAEEGSRVLRELIFSCYEAEERFRSVAANSHDWTLKRLFEIFAQQRTRFAEELRDHLPLSDDNSAQGGDPLSNQSSPGESFLQDCLESDSRTLQLYRKALASRAIPTRTQFLISSQLALLERAHERVTSLIEKPELPVRPTMGIGGRVRA
jgi:hypothetical protein